MKKNIKRIACVLGYIVGVLVIALVCLIIFLDPIIKGVIEGFGPKIAGVRFEVEDISTSIFRGRVAIKNLIMYNSEGYNSEYAAKLGDVVFHTEVMSRIFGKKAIIREVRLRDITLNYETELPISTQSNLSAILDNVKKAAGANAPAPAEESAVQEESPAPAAESACRNLKLQPPKKLLPMTLLLLRKRKENVFSWINLSSTTSGWS